MRPKLYNGHELLTDYDLIGVVLIVTTIVFLQFVSGCQLGSDDEQVQVVLDMDEFTSFVFPPRNVIYGPYTLNVTSGSSIISWEERKS